MTQSEYSINIKVDQMYRNGSYLGQLKEAALTHGVVLNFVEDDQVLLFEDQVFMLGEKGRFSLDWIQDLKLHYKKKYALKSQPLAKSLGITDHNAEHRVIDCTLGTGKDAILLLSFGAKLECFERKPEVFILALDAWLRASKDPDYGETFKKRMKLNLGQAWESDFGDSFELAYFDPMYPEKKKKALPRKEMQVFKEIVGEDQDIESVFEQLLMKFKRVVVKRPVKSDLVKKGAVSFCGKTTRYDRYGN